MGKRQKKQQKEKKDIKLEKLEQGISIYRRHPLFSRMDGMIEIYDSREMGRKIPYTVNRTGQIYLNKDYYLESNQWAYGIAHCLLHLAFGHFDKEKMPGIEFVKENGEKEQRGDFNRQLWNQACDIYIAKFLSDIKFGEPIIRGLEQMISGKAKSEQEIYYELLWQEKEQAFMDFFDMDGLETPLVYKTGSNRFERRFAYALAESTSEAVSNAGGYDWYEKKYMSKSQKAAQWFMNHYPLLGGIASSFKIIEDYIICNQKEVQVAAVDTYEEKIYVNPAAGLDEEELKFVLAHEFLHAGLQHQQRCQGRNEYLWNVACDYVINGWLVEMQIGKMPVVGLLYDEKLKDLSAESIYDLILENIREFEKLDTFRGYGKGDIWLNDKRQGTISKKGVPLDEFYKNALRQGLEYHQAEGRGFIPAGLVEEIRALTMPPISWDVELAGWFDCHFPPLEKKRTYVRPSRRQASTPDIIRPRYTSLFNCAERKTLGVVIDTSGSVSREMLGKALGSIASYAVAKEVPYVRVVFCDAMSYDAGYLAVEDIAGRVEVKGRGGTVLQPAIDLLETAEDFPKNGPILVITDGICETTLKISREHAFLIPKGNCLPFLTKGKVFYYS